MKGRRSIIVIDDFYSDPDAVREWALKQEYYDPYEGHSNWRTTVYRKYEDCPFKTNSSIVETLEAAIDEDIDMDNWRAPYPITEDENAKPRFLKTVAAQTACLWNCSIHVKFNSKQQLGELVHNHVTDYWNTVGYDGWAGLLYLNPDAPVDGGLYLWKNRNPANVWDWMTPREDWINQDKFGNLYNRLILVRGNVPHSGAAGWSESINTGRMFQTFFFRTNMLYSYSASISRGDLGL